MFPKMALRARGGIRHLPPHLSDPLYRLCEIGKLFIELYECKKGRMQVIANELGEISKEIKEMQKGTNASRMIGVALGGLGILALGAATYLGGAGKMTMLGGAAAVGGGATSVIIANAIKVATEETSLRTVEQLGNEFMEIVELQKDVLEEIQEVSQELEKKSSSLMTRTRAQARKGLLTTEQLQQFVTQTAKLAERSKAVMDVTLTVLRRMRELLNFIVSITRITPTSEEDAKLRHCITGSALQCEKTVYEFAKMRNALKDFEEM